MSTKKSRKRSDFLMDAGLEVVKHDSDKAVEEAQDIMLDRMFQSEDRHEVRGGIGRVKGRLVIDLECSWPEPPYSNPEEVFETVKAYVVKALAAHKYMQFTGITVRGQIDSD